MTALGVFFAPLFGWFFGIVGREAKAEIQRKKAVAAKVARLKKKKEKAAAKAEVKRLAARDKIITKLYKESVAEFEREEKSKKVQADLERQLTALEVTSSENETFGGVPYDSER